MPSVLGKHRTAAAETTSMPWPFIMPSTLLILLFMTLAYRLLQIGKRHPRMPKGPPTVPILGNAHLIPTTGLAKK